MQRQRTRMVEWMRVRGPAPKWAVDLLIRIGKEMGGEYRVYTLDWNDKIAQGSTGLAYLGPGRRIAMKAAPGCDRKRLRVVLLHEVAHIASQSTHTREMYRVAWPLWRKYAPSITAQTIFGWEGAYKTTCISVAKELGIRGARAALTKQRKLNATDPWKHTHRYTLQWIRPGRFEGTWDRAEHCTKPVGDDGTPCGMSRVTRDNRPPTEAERAALIETAA